jgi:hypothetical protein
MSVPDWRRYSPPAISLPVEKNSLFRITGNSKLRLWKRWGISDLNRSRRPETEEIPCIFPAYQGSALRDEFAPDFPPPPLSLRTQRLVQYIQVQTEKFTRFRGVLGVGVV